ncbi:lachesin-like [Mytilus californianus]|uniref:lachesin-like n=1 Tax=Mytilus californianus TaxID=6549 RepID=UPI002247AFC2|nr:lachesin-like [Mytilus californianus]
MNLFAFLTVLSSTIVCVSSMGTRPEIVDDILPEVKQQGQIGYLNCSVINLDPSSAELQWVKRTTPSGTPLLISSNENIHINDVVEGHPKYYIRKSAYNNRELYQLIIRALTETDAGYYSCMIRLSNQNYLQWPKKLGLLTVQIAPTVKLDSASNIVVQEGSNITLKCEANGIPTPNITWKRGDGLPLPGGGFQHWGGVYQIYNINAVNRGQFLCIADNNVKPPADYAVQIEVTFSPYCEAQLDSVGQVQNRRFSAKLDCIVAANPRAEVIWYKVNPATGSLDQIQDNDKYDLNQQDDQRLKADEKWYSLTIKTVQGSDFGKFFCHAQNRFGKGNASFVLFETMECQGPNCPSIGGNGAQNVHISVLTFTLTIIASYFFILLEIR